jgi:hypothetical protein
LKYIHTTPTRCAFIENVLSEVDKARNGIGPILFYGRISHIFYYLTNTKPLYQNSFWMSPDDPTELQLVEEILVKYKPVVFLLMDYPGESKNYSQRTSAKTKIEDLLLSEGYSVSTKDSFKVFYPSMIMQK